MPPTEELTRTDKLWTVLLHAVIFGVWLIFMVTWLSGCTHKPPVIDVQPIEKIHLGSVLPGTVEICVERPHQNSFFDTPVARGDNAPCITLDALRHWIARQRATE